MSDPDKYHPKKFPTRTFYQPSFKAGGGKNPHIPHNRFQPWSDNLTNERSDEYKGKSFRFAKCKGSFKISKCKNLIIPPPESPVDDCNDYVREILDCGVDLDICRRMVLLNFFYYLQATDLQKEIKALYLPVYGNACANAINVIDPGPNGKKMSFYGDIEHGDGYIKAGKPNSSPTSADYISLNINPKDAVTKDSAFYGFGIFDMRDMETGPYIDLGVAQGSDHQFFIKGKVNAANNANCAAYDKSSAANANGFPNRKQPALFVVNQHPEQVEWQGTYNLHTHSYVPGSHFNTPAFLSARTNKINIGDNHGLPNGDLYLGSMNAGSLPYEASPRKYVMAIVANGQKLPGPLLFLLRWLNRYMVDPRALKGPAGSTTDWECSPKYIIDPTIPEVPTPPPADEQPPVPDPNPDPPPVPEPKPEPDTDPNEPPPGWTEPPVIVLPPAVEGTVQLRAGVAQVQNRWRLYFHPGDITISINGENPDDKSLADIAKKRELAAWGVSQGFQRVQIGSSTTDIKLRRTRSPSKDRPWGSTKSSSKIEDPINETIPAGMGTVGGTYAFQAAKGFTYIFITDKSNIEENEVAAKTLTEDNETWNTWGWYGQANGGKKTTELNPWARNSNEAGAKLADGSSQWLGSDPHHLNSSIVLINSSVIRDGVLDNQNQIVPLKEQGGPSDYGALPQNNTPDKWYYSTHPLYSTIDPILSEPQTTYPIVGPRSITHGAPWTPQRELDSYYKFSNTLRWSPNYIGFEKPLNVTQAEHITTNKEKKDYLSDLTESAMGSFTLRPSLKGEYIGDGPIKMGAGNTAKSSIGGGGVMGEFSDQEFSEIPQSDWYKREAGKTTFTCPPFEDIAPYCRLIAKPSILNNGRGDKNQEEELFPAIIYVDGNNGGGGLDKGSYGSPCGGYILMRRFPGWQTIFLEKHPEFEQIFSQFEDDHPVWGPRDGDVDRTTAP